MTLLVLNGQQAASAPVTPTGPYPWFEEPDAPAAVWTFAVGPWNGQPDTELSDATDRSVTWRLTGSSEASITLPGLSDQVTHVHELQTDLWVLRNGQALFCGRVGAVADTADPDTYTVQFGAADYRALLQRRYLFEGDTLSYLNTDQSSIGWGLISTTQNHAGGNLGIVRGAGQTTGVIRDRSDYVAGKPIGEALDQLSQVIDGFDYDFTPNIQTGGLAFDVYYPARGVDLGRVLDYGGRVAGFTRQTDPGTFMNAVRGTGADGLAAVRAESATISTDPAGRWDGQFADTSVTLATTLAAKTTKALAAGQYLTPSWSVTLKPGTWYGPTDFWLGDQVTLVVKLGRLNVVESLRVMEITVAVDADNNETVAVTLGAPNPALRRLARRVDQRLAALERR